MVRSFFAVIIFCISHAAFAQMSVTSFTGINAQTDSVIAELDPINDSAVIDLNGYPSLSIRANVSGAVDSVKFTLNGQPFSVENVAPYAMAGDSSGDYNALSLTPGDYTLIATPYPDADAGGNPGTAAQISFTLVQGGGGTVSVDAGSAAFIVLPQTTARLNGSAAASALVQWTQVEGPTLAELQNPNAVDTSVSGLSSGYYVFELTAMDDGSVSGDQTAVLVADPGADDAGISGQLKKWHPVTLDFNGPFFTEIDNNPNPFLDRRLRLWLRSPDGRIIERPGFFAGNGNGGDVGAVWRVRISPGAAGTWYYVADFRKGVNSAVSLSLTAGTTTSFSGASGSFTVGLLDPTAPGFLSKGRLEYVGKHYLRFADGRYWIKGGTDSPENFLGYYGFDNTIDHGNLPPGGSFVHAYLPHVADWQPGNPDWGNNDGRGIIGALNYLSEAGVNSIYFLPMNLGGDGQETYPFVGASSSTFDKTHYDISKLFQWNKVLSHAQRRGVALHIVLNETEGGNENWLDSGSLGAERKLFYRELMARFGHHPAIKWNLSEENDFSIAELRQFASYIQALDSRRQLITVHTKPNNFTDYQQILGESWMTNTSIQYSPNSAGDHVETWRENSANAGHPWILDMDENGPAGTGLTDSNADDLRKRVLYDIYFSGGQVEWYAGYHPRPPANIGGDITLENFRTREAMWDYMYCARSFMQSYLPFAIMEPNDALVSGESDGYGGAEVFAVRGDNSADKYAIYLPDASNAVTLNMGASSGGFEQYWFNPRTCAFAGPGISRQAGPAVNLGLPPSSANQDWVIFLRQAGCDFDQGHVDVFNAQLASQQTIGACMSVILGPDFEVTAGAEVEVVAGRKIRIRPNFRVEQGAEFRATIDW